MTFNKTSEWQFQYDKNSVGKKPQLCQQYRYDCDFLCAAS